MSIASTTIAARPNLLNTATELDFFQNYVVLSSNTSSTGDQDWTKSIVHVDRVL